MEPLTEQEQALLAFARRRWQHRGAKDEAILREFGWSPWRYEQALMTVCEQPASLVADPMLVNRLRKRTQRA